MYILTPACNCQTGTGLAYRASTCWLYFATVRDGGGMTCLSSIVNSPISPWTLMSSAHWMSPQQQWNAAHQPTPRMTRKCRCCHQPYHTTALLTMSTVASSQFYGHSQKSASSCHWLHLKRTMSLTFHSSRLQQVHCVTCCGPSSPRVFPQEEDVFRGTPDVALQWDTPAAQMHMSNVWPTRFYVLCNSAVRTLVAWQVLLKQPLSCRKLAMMLSLDPVQVNFLCRCKCCSFANWSVFIKVGLCVFSNTCSYEFS